MALDILLVDDHQVLREGLRHLLTKMGDVQVVGEASNGSEGIRMTEELRPDIILMDVTMPGLNGVEATRRIKKDHPEVKVIALSMQTDRQYVVGMFRAGASAYLVKDCSFDDLSTAIRKIHSGGTFISPQVVDQVVDELQDVSHQSEGSPSSRLTSREREILQLIAEARKSKEIAEQLNISLKTVYTHRRNIMDKLEARNLAELTRIAIRDGLASLDA